MQQLEAFRKEHLSATDGLIIPVIYKDSEYYNSKQPLKNRIAYDFSSFGLWGGVDIYKSPELNLKIREIAKYITQRYREYKEAYPVCNHQDGHELVTEQVAKDWLTTSWRFGNDHCLEAYPLD